MKKENDVENTSQNQELENQNEKMSVTPKKKITPGTIVVPAVIVIILAVFVCVVYWAKVIKPNNDMDEKLGFKTEDYIELEKYEGLSYEITQEEWDECVGEETNTYQEVNREARDTDMIYFDYTGYVDGKKDDNISAKECSLTIGAEEGIYKTFSDAIKGHKKKDKITVKVTDPSEIAANGASYQGKTATFQIKISSVDKLLVDKITDKWVKNNYFDEMGISTKKEFYDWIKEYLIENSVKPSLWEEVVNNAYMNGYPAALYNEIVEEVNGHMEAEAEYQGTSLEDYLDTFGYTDEKLEEEYTYNVKSELVMWQLVKDLKLDATDEEIEQKYEDEYSEVNLESVEEMKELYTKDEMREAVLLEKAQNYIYDHAKISFSYEIKE